MGRLICVLGGVVVILGAGVLAEEKAPESYSKAMKASGASVQSLGKSVETKDYDALGKEAMSLKMTFTDLEKFWTDRKIEDAMTFARAGLKASTDLVNAARSKDDAAIGDARKALTGSCGGCHAAHREKLADGTFSIK